MQTSQNGWPVLAADSPHLHTWVIPCKTGTVKLRLRDGSAGFLLAMMVLYIGDHVTDITKGTPDDWGYACRLIRGSTTTVSNHASGTAADVDASKHPLGKTGTWPWAQVLKIRWRLLAFKGCVRWGGDYKNRVDSMHFEINKPIPAVERVARSMARTKNGHRLLLANNGQWGVIFS